MVVTVKSRVDVETILVEDKPIEKLAVLSALSYSVVVVIKSPIPLFCDQRSNCKIHAEISLENFQIKKKLPD